MPHPVIFNKLNSFCEMCFICQCLPVHKGDLAAFIAEVKMFFIDLWPPCWCSSAWAPTWRFYTVLCKFVWNILTDSSSTTEYRTNPRRGQADNLIIFYNLRDQGATPGDEAVKVM